MTIRLYNWLSRVELNDGWLVGRSLGRSRTKRGEVSSSVGSIRGANNLSSVSPWPGHRIHHHLDTRSVPICLITSPVSLDQAV